jgi:hypothetical protein
LCQAEYAPPTVCVAGCGTTPFVTVFSTLDTSLLDACYTQATITFGKEVIPINEGARFLSIKTLKTLKTLFTKNELLGKEDWSVVLEKLINVLSPSAQPFRGAGKGLPSKGSGPRLTDRKHYK